MTGSARTHLDWTAPPSSVERAAMGRAVRRTVPRSALAQVTAAPRDPMGIIREQNAARVPELIPLRTERMSQSPFTFYRGTAALMAADLADEARLKQKLTICRNCNSSQ